MLRPMTPRDGRMEGSEPIAGSTPSSGWSAVQIVVLVVILVVTNVATGLAIYFLTPRPDPPLVVSTKTLFYVAQIDTDQAEATVYSSDTKGPFTVEATSPPGSLEDCTLTVNEQESHRAKCSSFHYEYRFQARAGFKISFEFTVSLGFPSNGPLSPQVSVQIAREAEIQPSANVELRVVDEESGFLLAYGYKSQTQSDSFRTFVATFDLPPNASAEFPETFKGRVWVNITASTTLTYEMKVNGLVVVEGTCAGIIVTSYYWVDSKLDFSFELTITAEEVPVAGILTLEGITD